MASLPTILIIEMSFWRGQCYLITCKSAALWFLRIKIIETRVPINLVLTDVRMPGSMNGFGLAKWIGSNTPQISVIIASGEATQTDAANELCDHIPLFKKPYDLKAIVAGIRATLDGDEGPEH